MTDEHAPLRSRLKTLAEVEREYVLFIYESCGGNQTVAARVLEIDRKTLKRWLRRWGVEDLE